MWIYKSATNLERKLKNYNLYYPNPSKNNTSYTLKRGILLLLSCNNYFCTLLHSCLPYLSLSLWYNRHDFSNYLQKDRRKGILQPTITMHFPKLSPIVYPQKKLQPTSIYAMREIHNMPST